MRRLTTWVALLLSAAGLMVAATAGPSTATQARTSMWIHPWTGKIFQFDGSPDGTGPTFPAASVAATIRHCPEGDYQLNAVFWQDGVEGQWATTALGAGEILCDGSAKPVQTGMAFYSPTLHPGRAWVRFSVVDFETGEVLVQRSRFVHIPR